MKKKELEQRVKELEKRVEELEENKITDACSHITVYCGPYPKYIPILRGMPIYRCAEDLKLEIVGE